MDNPLTYHSDKEVQAGNYFYKSGSLLQAH